MKFDQKMVADVLIVFFVLTGVLVLEVLNDFQMTKMIRDLWNSFQ